ncbi:MAG: hypothetical protein JNL62_24100 [Bryobacterales bacterium]|nr:hypothetical protein [Bryobacterales bacterium]
MFDVRLPSRMRIGNAELDAVARDEKRFLVNTALGDGNASTMTVVSNWLGAVKK